MSRILRRPMFRGGSTSNEGIMSVPRKEYQGAGVVKPGYEENDQADYGEDVQVRDRIDINSLPDMSGKKTGTGTGTDKKQLSYSDLLTQEYLGNRPDPMGKFLIQFGLNYMSATPKSGKFGALATAAESAKKPTEQLYADIDTDRLLKLKLMTALGKGESKGAFEKKVNFIWDSEQGKIKSGRPSTFKSKEEVVDYLRKQESETKSQSVEDQVNADASKRVEANKAPNMKIAKSMSYFDLFGVDKIPKNEANALANNYFLPPRSLSPKPNSTDFELSGDEVKNLESKIGKLKSGQTYVEPSKQQVFLYVGNNAFRPLSKY
jgi:hypothetical protein